MKKGSSFCMETRALWDYRNNTGSVIMLNSLYNDRVIKYNLDMLLCFHVSLHYILLVSCSFTFVTDNQPKLWRPCSYLWIVEYNLFKLKSCSCDLLIDMIQLKLVLNTGLYEKQEWNVTKSRLHRTRAYIQKKPNFYSTTFIWQLLVTFQIKEYFNIAEYHSISYWVR